MVLTAGAVPGCAGAIKLADAGVLGGAGGDLVAAPTGGVPNVAHKGVVFVTATTEGVSAHGSAPHLGRNAIYPLARAVTALADVTFDVPTHPVLGDPTINVGTFGGGTSINVVPDRAEAQIDVRTVPGLTGEAVLERLHAACGPDVTLQPWIDLEPVVTDPDDPWVRSVVALAGGPDEPSGLTYFTDAAALVPAYGNPPTVIWGPGEAAQAHQTNEWAEAAKNDAAADGFFEVARRWCGV
jgi:succinyl-diaminopimelate desuccinylase